MSKHTTDPMVWRRHQNSHASMYSMQELGNWNRHKKRRVPSRVRTVGRLARALRRIALNNKGRSEPFKRVYPNARMVHAATELNRKYLSEAENIIGPL